MIHGQNLVIIHLVNHVRLYSGSSGMVHVNTGRDRVTERHLGIHFHILQSSFVAVLVGCEGIVVTAWSGERQVSELHHCFEVFR